MWGEEAIVEAEMPVRSLLPKPEAGRGGEQKTEGGLVCW